MKDKIILFDGTSLDAFDFFEPKSKGPWKLHDGIMTVDPGAGDVASREKFRDHFLHLEYQVPYMPDKTGQYRGNSGVFLQGIYELQVLDSYGVENFGDDDNGSFYKYSKALVNASLPPLEWQSLDVAFRGPRLDADGNITEYPRATVFLNGILIHNNVELTRPTGGFYEEFWEWGPLILQDHGDPVSYRNIWVQPLE